MSDTKYDPRAPLSESEVNQIAQALNGQMSSDARALAALGPDVIKYCAEHDLDPVAVYERELNMMRVRYRLLERFVYYPLAFEMFESIAKEGWS